MLRTEAMALIKEEYYRATTGFPPFHTNHEGHSLIEEEFDELWDEIKARHPSQRGQKANDNQPHSALTNEAVQLGAMALRFLVDRCDA